MLFHVAREAAVLASTPALRSRTGERFSREVTHESQRHHDHFSRHSDAQNPKTDITKIAKCLLERRISAVPVVDASERLVGIVSEGDLMRRAESGTERRPSWWLSLLADPERQARDYVKSHGRLARDVMTRKVITVSENAPLEKIAALLEKYRIKRVPVVRNGKLVGIVSRSNLLQGLVAHGTSHAPSADDRKIKARIEKALAKTGVRKEYLNVVVSKGHVDLWGIVESEAQKEAVRVVAENIVGPKAVNNGITVTSFVGMGMWE